MSNCVNFDVIFLKWYHLCDRERQECSCPLFATCHFDSENVNVVRIIHRVFSLVFLFYLSVCFVSTALKCAQPQTQSLHYYVSVFHIIIIWWNCAETDRTTISTVTKICTRPVRCHLLIFILTFIYIHNSMKSARLLVNLFVLSADEVVIQFLELRIFLYPVSTWLQLAVQFVLNNSLLFAVQWSFENEILFSLCTFSTCAISVFVYFWKLIKIISQMLQVLCLIWKKHIQVAWGKFQTDNCRISFVPNSHSAIPLLVPLVYN